MSAHADQSSDPTDASPTSSALPALAALFLVKFDERKGYTLAWQRTAGDLNIDGNVEFKSMPSGLHNVREDLVYFVYDEYVGISAVLNVEDEQAARKAKIIAVGALIPLEHGRMGKSWLQAKNLKELAEKQIKNETDFSALEQFWEENALSIPLESEEIVESTPNDDLTIDTNVDWRSNGYQKNRSMSIGTLLKSSDYAMPEHHPALALPDFVHLFGPLIFPLVRAALLRKRILFLGETPVEKTCNYVYNLSVLSSLPKPIANILPALNPAHIRLRPLLNVGIADIPFLEADSKSSDGWIACTTDDVICTKPDLFDVLVILPDTISQKQESRKYPRIYLSTPELSKARPKHGLRASQRDAKRFTTFWQGLKSMPRSTNPFSSMVDSGAIASSSSSSHASEAQRDRDETSSIASSVQSVASLKSVVEPQSWSQIAYIGLVWWASAGDKRGGLTEMEEMENEQDVALLSGEVPDEEDGRLDEQVITKEVACAQYFQRLSNLIFTATGEAIRRSDGYESRYRDEDGAEAAVQEQPNQDGEDIRDPLIFRSEDNVANSQETVEITQDDVQSMGLDVWSSSDREFLEELVQFWWKRKAIVHSGRIDCCGIRVL